MITSRLILLNVSVNAFISLEKKLQNCFNHIFYSKNPKVYTLLKICSQISINMSFLHLHPRLLWQRDHIATNKWYLAFFLLIKDYQIFKYEENQWLCESTIFDSFVKLFLIMWVNIEHITIFIHKKILETIESSLVF